MNWCIQLERRIGVLACKENCYIRFAWKICVFGLKGKFLLEERTCVWIERISGVFGLKG